MAKITTVLFLSCFLFLSIGETTPSYLSKVTDVAGNVLNSGLNYAINSSYVSDRVKNAIVAGKNGYENYKSEAEQEEKIEPIVQAEEKLEVTEVAPVSIKKSAINSMSSVLSGGMSYAQESSYIPSRLKSVLPGKQPTPTEVKTVAPEPLKIEVTIPKEAKTEQTEPKPAKNTTTYRQKVGNYVDSYYKSPKVSWKIKGALVAGRATLNGVDKLARTWSLLEAGKAVAGSGVKSIMDIVPQSDPLAKAGTEFVKDIVGGKEVDTSILKLTNDVIATRAETKNKTETDYLEIESNSTNKTGGITTKIGNTVESIMISPRTHYSAKSMIVAGKATLNGVEKLAKTWSILEGVKAAAGTGVKSVVDIVYPTPKPGLVKAGTDFIKDLCDGKELESSMLRCFQKGVIDFKNNQMATLNSKNTLYNEK